MSIIPITWHAHILPIMHLINPFLLILFLLPTSPIIFPIILIIELIRLTSLHHFLSPSMVLTIPTYPSPPFLSLNLHIPPPPPFLSLPSTTHPTTHNPHLHSHANVHHTTSISNHGSKSRYRSLTRRVPRRIGLGVSAWYRVIRKIS